MGLAIKRVTDVLLSGSTFLLSLIILTIGIVTSGYTANFRIADNYETSSCILTTPSTVSIGCVANYYVAVWSSSTGGSVLQSPFAASKSKQYVDAQLNNYPLNVPIECMCRKDTSIAYPSIEKQLPCDVYGQCFLNTQAIEFMKEQHYLYGIGVALIVFGILGILIVLGLFTATCIQRRRARYTELNNI